MAHACGVLDSFAMDHLGTFTRETGKALAAAGWYAGRAVDTAHWEAELAAEGYPPLHAVARQFLAEYGGLWLPDGGPGVTRAREPFSLMPTACSGEADRFIGWSEHIDRNLAPIGELASGTCGWAFLGIDEQAEIYLVIDGLASFSRMPIAMDNLVLGYMPHDID
jgi:hypothetical protein